MSERYTASEFHEAAGAEDWRIVANCANARFHVGSFSAAVTLVGAIGDVARDAHHDPHVDLRGPVVTIRLSAGEHGFERGDVEVARRISAAARALGGRAEPDMVQEVMLTIDTLAVADVRPFWRAVLGYRDVGDDDLVDPVSRGPSIWFQPSGSSRARRNRLHVDVFVPHDRAPARVAAALAAGGRLVTDEHAPAWWVLADAEGNEACVATWQGRD